MVGAEPTRLWVAEALPRPPPRAIPPGVVRVFVVLSGERRVSLGNGGRVVMPRLRTGEAMFVPKDAWQRADDDADNVILIVERRAAGAQAYLRFYRHGGGAGVVLGPRREVSVAAVRGVFEVVGRLVSLGEFDAARAAVAVLLRLGLGAVLAERPTRAVTRQEALVAEIEAYLREHAARAISRKSVAAHFRIHPNHLSRLFARHGADGFAHQLAAARVQLAAELLGEQKGLSVKEAATRAGFGDGRYFAKVFRRLMGVPPSRYVAATRDG